ncbi:hypothetical protein [Haladaptatus halobius]|uniref:hypothetical protein n=1 Tax=Haladaptatus halobius TaxID=2884875 RepID=UPI001D0B3E16|nr:hypothetical protein [Haladaptatus halobius]
MSVAGVRYFGIYPNGALDHLADVLRENGERHRSNIHLVVCVRVACVFGNHLGHHVDLRSRSESSQIRSDTSRFQRSTTHSPTKR